MDWRGCWRPCVPICRPSAAPGACAARCAGSKRRCGHAARGRAAVRNIVYRDVGTAADKQALHAILSDLCAEAGLSAPPLHLPPGSPADLELLGRRKKRAFRTFMAALRAGRVPRLIVAGPPGVGKTLLIEHLERETAAQHPALQVTRLLLGADWARRSIRGWRIWVRSGRWSCMRGCRSRCRPSSKRSSPGRLCAAACRLTPQREGAEGVRGALLIRVQQGGQFSGTPPRDGEAAPISAAAWAAEHLLRRAPAGLAVLLALEDDREPDPGGPGRGDPVAAAHARRGPRLPDDPAEGGRGAGRRAGAPNRATSRPTGAAGQCPQWAEFRRAPATGRPGRRPVAGRLAGGAGR